MQLDAAQARAPLTAGSDGRILLSTDPAVSALPAVAGEDASALFPVDAIRVGDGETLVVQAPNGGPVRLSAGVLEVGAGGRVVMETFVELRADRAVFATGSAVVLVGADGGPGPRGGNGGSGNRSLPNGGNGEGGKPGGGGEPGPGGRIHVGELSGALTVVAGGGNGGPGGEGGRGGNGVMGYGSEVGRGGAGGAGGAGGDGGEGGTVVIAVGTLMPGCTIQPVVRRALGGAGGAGGGGGDSARAGTPPGAPGAPGVRGADGDPPVFLIRPVA